MVLGAGLVTRPIVHYLSNTCQYKVTLGSRTLSKAQELCKGAVNATAIEVDVENEAHLQKLEEIIPGVDAVVSMLPYLFHAKVCAIAIRHKKHFLTTSYVSPAMRDLEAAAKEAGVVLVNECGVDPGTDHMSAQKLIDEVHAKGGKIVGFKSFCGGLPAPADNNNPLGYKFSWAPRGVLLASRNTATFLRDGKEVTIPGADLFSSYEIQKVEGLESELESYPNRDSIQYLKIYGIENECKSIIRGTYRNRGWCDVIKKLSDLGYLSLTEQDLNGKTYSQLTASTLKDGASGDLQGDVAKQLGLESTDRIITTMKWLGLFDALPVPANTKTMLDALCSAMLERMQYAEGEVDMLVMLHTFDCEFPKESLRRIYTCRLLDFGIKGGDSSMSRTVSLPVAIATKLVLEGKLSHLKGLVMPTLPELYNPILQELESMGIVFREKLEKELPL
uniref:Saccharopine dehydrogenase n=1 Tax=Arcella intermedia TaxID=1963864 RepID=A0A6B2L3S6_9EUKA